MDVRLGLAVFRITCTICKLNGNSVLASLYLVNSGQLHLVSKKVLAFYQNEGRMDLLEMLFLSILLEKQIFNTFQK